MSNGEETLRKVGRYELVRKIATGGMAELFLAKFSGPGGFEKRCALKQILPQFVEDEEFKRMFQNEARVAAMFDHPNLVQIFELDEDPATKRFYIAMELINGMDLRQLQNLAREQGQQIPPELASWVVGQTLDGLAYAHDFKDSEGNRLNLVHRDISPQNILVSYEGAIKVVDFGIVKASSNEGKTQTGMLKGKIAYMSPEQALGEKLDARSDLFAVGICLYELIAGVKPFRGANEIMTLRAILEQDPPPITNFVPDCPRGIERVIYRSLAKNRDERYQDAREFQIDLTNVLRQTPLPLDRHVFSEFLKTLTESGTDRFDSTKLKIPRISTSAELDPEPTPSPMRFAGSQPTAAPEAPASVAPPRADSGASAAAFAPPVSSVGPATSPGVAAPDLNGPSEDSMVSSVRAAGVGQKNSMLVVIGIATVALIAVVGWFFFGEGSEPQPIQATTPAPRTVKNDAAKPAEKKPDVAPKPVAANETAKPDVAATVEKAAPKTKTAVDETPKQNTTPPAVVAKVEQKKPAQRPKAGKSTRPTSTKKPTPPKPAPAPAPKVRAGKLTLNTVPKGLTVRLGSKNIGKTPLNNVNIPVGDHKLSVSSKPFGISKALQVSVSDGGSVTRKLVFARGTIKVLSRPSANVSINGRSKGMSPTKKLPMYEGKHEVRLTTNDGREETRIINLKGGQNEIVKVVFR
ncbi:MAG: protein kinase [Myxococcota bacterium]|nr:protein kinase [Myxococcota bacterium]